MISIAGRIIVVLLFLVRCNGLSTSLAHRWSHTWWPVGFSRTLCEESPQAVTILGAPVVIWKDTDAWRASLDRCPHRFARLSEGRITSSGSIECPYHGWQFEGRTGSCLEIPQDETEVQKLKACATVLPTREKNGMVFVWSGPLYGDIDSVPDENKLKQVAMDHLFSACDNQLLGTDYSRDLPMDATILAENVLDPSHLPFTHHKTISNRARASPLTLTKIMSNIEEGFTFRKGRKDEANASRVEFIAPSIVLSVTDRGPQSYQDYNLVYAVPTVPGSCRLHVRILFEADKIPNFVQRSILKAVFSAPLWFTHLANHKILEDDNLFLYHANREMTLGTGEAITVDNTASRQRALPGVIPNSPLAPSWQSRLFQPTAADAAVVAYRRWLDEATDGYGPVYSPWLPLDCREAPAPKYGLIPETVLERGHAHTDKCAPCAQARDRFQRLSAYSLVLAIVAFVFNSILRTTSLLPSSLLLELSSGLLAPFAFGLHILLDTRILPLFERGRYPPPRNSPPFV